MKMYIIKKITSMTESFILETSVDSSTLDAEDIVDHPEVYGAEGPARDFKEQYVIKEVQPDIEECSDELR